MAGLSGGETRVCPNGATAAWPQLLAGVRTATAAVLLAIAATCGAQSATGFLQQGPKLVGFDYTGAPNQGSAIAVSGDGNTLIVGAPDNNSDAGAAWVFVRNNGVWTQQGTKLVGANGSANALQGVSVALSADGNTAIIGGQEDNTHQGAAWIYRRNNGVWTQQGPKLVVTSASAQQLVGQSVALSTDGNTAAVGADGGVFVFTRSGQTWSQYVGELIGTSFVGFPSEGNAVAISGDGKTILESGYTDNSNNGAAWVFKLSNGTWTQQGAKLTIFGSSGQNDFGKSLGLSADGNTAVIGSPEYNGTGAAWIFKLISGTWFQVKELLGTGYDSSFPPSQGYSVSISADGDTVTSGGDTDSATIGAAWVFTKPAAHDLEASGESDIVWRQSGGDVAVWLMKNASVLASADLGNVSTTWSVVGQRDFDGDGNADLLWRDTAGNVAIWFMQGTTVRSATIIGNVSTSWSVVGLGDFNVDGKADIVWRNANGDIGIWLMNGSQILQAADLGNVPTNWSVSGVDFNGNIFWRDSVSGTLAVWAVSGLQLLQTYNFGTVPSNWSVVGLGDFDGNGLTDILWRDSNTGAAAIWLTKIIGGYGVQTTGIVGTVPSDWSIVETGDFDGDGKSDILWRNTSGDVALWFINGTQLTQGLDIGNVATSWTIQGVNAD